MEIAEVRLCEQQDAQLKGYETSGTFLVERVSVDCQAAMC